MHRKIPEGDDYGFHVSGGMNGRLTPLALDNTRHKLHATSLSVTMGGLTQKQIDDVQFVPTGLLTRLCTALAPWLPK